MVSDTDNKKMKQPVMLHNVPFYFLVRLYIKDIFHLR